MSASKRDLKGYLQKYTGKPTIGENTTESPSRTSPLEPNEHSKKHHIRNVAIVKIRNPQCLNRNTISGIAKTLSQLRALGLLSLVVVDCGIEADRKLFEEQSLLICEALESFSRPGAKLLDAVVVKRPLGSQYSARIVGESYSVVDHGALAKALDNGLIAVIPSLVREDDTFLARPADAREVVTGLTKYLVGLQFETKTQDPSSEHVESTRPLAIASVERIIILDPLGGTPVTGRPGASHRFINLEQEYDLLQKEMEDSEGYLRTAPGGSTTLATRHGDNLCLIKETLAILPPTSSALITTPYSAANTHSVQRQKATRSTNRSDPSTFGFSVTTRTRQNPLLHNLLTDKPVFSSSLPVKHYPNVTVEDSLVDASSGGTLVKRGMPLSIFPNPYNNPWKPPAPDAPRLRLTDTCIDLPRLVYLIENSFGRKLDLNDYLRRVNENLAGVIVAGEYEGGAILTWEVPEGIDRSMAYQEGRLVPYLDKFAVLKSRQGSGGVADIVFNAMVRDAFPGGVCWRSRKNNPVNKWYFERSAGASKLYGCDWSMFWTTLNLHNQHPILQDYESACRKVKPSWADNKHILD